MTDMEVTLKIMTGTIWILMSLFILIGAFQKYPSNIQSIFNEKAFLGKQWLFLVGFILLFLGIYKLK